MVGNIGSQFVDEDFSFSSQRQIRAANACGPAAKMSQRKPQDIVQKFLPARSQGWSRVLVWRPSFRAAVPYAAVDQHRRTHGATCDIPRASVGCNAAGYRPSDTRHWCVQVSLRLSAVPRFAVSCRGGQLTQQRLPVRGHVLQYATAVLAVDQAILLLLVWPSAPITQRGPRPIFAPIPMQCNAMFSGAEYARYMRSRGPREIIVAQSTLA